MTSNQIALREVKEKERHNRVTEEQGFESNRITEEHYIRADHAALINAYASQRQAAAAEQNAVTNRINATTNQYNAETQRMLAENQIQYNMGMLAVAEWNANTNEMNALTNQKNAETNWQNALTRMRELDHQIYVDQQTIDIKRESLKVDQKRSSLYADEVNLKIDTLDEQKREFNIEEKRRQKDSNVRNRSITVNTLLGIGNGIVNAVSTLGKFGQTSPTNATMKGLNDTMVKLINVLE